MTPPSAHTQRDLTCRELVELVSDYVEGVLTDTERARFERHIAGCADCTRYVAQIRVTILAAGRLREEAVPAGVRDLLLARLRAWKRAAT